VDVAYRLRRDEWQGVERFQLELEAIRSSGDAVVLQRRGRTYWCRRQGDSLVIRNAEGEELRSAIAGAAPSDSLPAPEDAHPYVRALVRDAAMALGVDGG
jgi:single-stranded-DNA-specific exonuclease